MPPEMFSDLGTKRKYPDAGLAVRARAAPAQSPVPETPQMKAWRDSPRRVPKFRNTTRRRLRYGVAGSACPSKLGSYKKSRRIRAEPCGFESLWNFMGTEPTPTLLVIIPLPEHAPPLGYRRCRCNTHAP